MIKQNNTVVQDTFENEIKHELNNFNIPGYISMKILKMIFNMFTYVYLNNPIEYKNTEESKKFKAFIDLFALEYFRGTSIYYSTVLFYKKLSDLVNLRKLEEDIFITGKNIADNKRVVKSSFAFDVLYNMYKESNLDIPQDFIIFSKELVTNDVKEISSIKSYSQIFKSRSIIDLKKKDLPFKLATKTLLVNSDVLNEDKNNKIVIMQDCTLSMTQYEDKLNITKAYILNEVLSKNLSLEWNFCNHEIYKKVEFTSKNILKENIENVFNGYLFDIEHLLVTLSLQNLHSIIIITDGEDNFNIPFKVKDVKINTISFNNNIGLKTNINRYGKFIKF